jgi:hypothetical protein
MFSLRFWFLRARSVAAMALAERDALPSRSRRLAWIPLYSGMTDVVHWAYDHGASDNAFWEAGTTPG